MSSTIRLWKVMVAIRKRILVVLHVCLLISTGSGLESLSARAHAAEPPMTPARLDGTPDSLVAQIVFPRVAADISVLILCDAVVLTTGALQMSSCWRRDDSNREFERAILRAVSNARVQPATVDGKAEAVIVHFSVLFDRHEGRESIDVYHHQFLDFDRYRANYIGPQVRVPRETRRCELKGTVWAAYTVDAAGKAHDVAVNRGRTAKSCAEYIEVRVLKSNYIPAHYQGRPVPARVLEPFYSSYDIPKALGPSR